MLVELVVANLVIVERAVLAPGEGLTVITGETGAGKSLLLDALDLVTGARARPGLVGRWGDAAVVTACFQVDQAVSSRLAEESGVDIADGQVILRRRVSEGGRSQAWVNDVPVTLTVLRTAADLLVDIHAQHEPIRLADPMVQMQLLDAFGGLGGLCAEYRQVHDQVTSTERELQALRAGGQESLRELDYLQFQLREFEELDPKQGELAALEARYAALSAIDEERDLAASLVDQIQDGDGAVLGVLQRLGRRLERVHDQRLREASVSLAQGIESLRDAALQASHLIDGVGVDPGELEGLTLRIDGWNALLRKHGPDESAVLAAWERIAGRVRGLAGLDERVTALDLSLRDLQARRNDLGGRLAAARRTAFARLATEVHGHLAELGMPKAQISLHESPSESPTALGLVRQAVHVCTNPGQPSGSIRDIASGGEAARLMLALSAALAAMDGMPVIVYDEVDSGVGGRLGGVIGAKLAHLAQGRTVIAVTHTPQLAACGTVHYRVAKLQGEDLTTVMVEQLAPPQRLEEVAEMLGGGPSALAQAGNLLAPSGGSQSQPSAKPRRRKDGAHL